MSEKEDETEKIKIGKTQYGEEKHFSVGAFIKKDGKIFLLERQKPPFGWACPAGHINEGEEPIEALVREVKEEVGLNITESNLIFYSADVPNQCRRGVDFHDWYIFECKTKGSISLNEKEAKKFKWCDFFELRNLNLEPVWALFLVMFERAYLI